MAFLRLCAGGECSVAPLTRAFEQFFTCVQVRASLICVHYDFVTNLHLQAGLELISEDISEFTHPDVSSFFEVSRLDDSRFLWMLHQCRRSKTNVKNVWLYALAAVHRRGKQEINDSRNKTTSRAAVACAERSPLQDVNAVCNSSATASWLLGFPQTPACKCISLKH